MTRVIMACILALTICKSQAQEESVMASGIGPTRRSAITEALANAVEMKSGITLSVEERSTFSAEATAVSSSSGDSDHTQLDDSMNKAIMSLSNGKISGYEIVSEGVDPTTNKHRVDVLVKFPARYVVGLDPENRRRMAIVDFRVVGNTYLWKGVEGSTVDWVRSLTDKLNVRFTKTRRFTMLERKFLAEINDELAGLSDANIAPGEIARRCQRLATDYLVVGEVKFYPVAAPQVNPYTGRPMTIGSQLFAEVNYRVVLAATGQLKFTDIIKIDAGSFFSGNIGMFQSETTDAAASLIIDGILANYRLRDEESDGSELTEMAVDTVNQTPVLQTAEPIAPTTIRGNGTGGIVTPF